MKTITFLSNVNALMQGMHYQSLSKSKSVIASAVGMKTASIPVASVKSVTSVTPTQIDNLITECNALISSHQNARNIIEDFGKQNAGNKAAAATKLEANNKKKPEMEIKIQGLEYQIKDYEDKEAKRTTESANLKVYYDSIENRKHSDNVYIPFYGIKYVCDTNNMVNDYNSRRRDWIVLSDWLDANRGRWHDQKSQLYALQSQLEAIKQENDALQKEGGKICELLTILNCLIAEFQSFLVGIGETKNDLTYSFIENAAATQKLIDTALTKISGYNDILQQKLVEYQTELSNDVVQEIKQLV